MESRPYTVLNSRRTVSQMSLWKPYGEIGVSGVSAPMSSVCGAPCTAALEM